MKPLLLVVLALFICSLPPAAHSQIDYDSDPKAILGKYYVAYYDAIKIIDAETKGVHADVLVTSPSSVPINYRIARHERFMRQDVFIITVGVHGPRWTLAIDDEYIVMPLVGFADNDIWGIEPHMRWLMPSEYVVEMSEKVRLDVVYQLVRMLSPYSDYASINMRSVDSVISGDVDRWDVVAIHTERLPQSDRYVNRKLNYTINFDNDGQIDVYVQGVSD